MKMAKASTADLEMAMELSRFVEELVDGYCPKQACIHDPEDEDSEEIEWLEPDDREQAQRIIEAIKQIARKGSIFRVTFGMAVVCDPRNELLDPDADTLEVHPKLKSNADRYHFLREFYALNSDECENEFKKLAWLSGPQFDAAVDAAMAQDKQAEEA